jgi:hypothetical protein
MRAFDSSTGAKRRVVHSFIWIPLDVSLSSNAHGFSSLGRHRTRRVGFGPIVPLRLDCFKAGADQPAPLNLCLLLLARIISRVDVVNASGPNELNLQDCFFVFSPNKMRLLGGHDVQCTGLDHFAL